jgi:hypothetical protein
MFAPKFLLTFAIALAVTISSTPAADAAPRTCVPKGHTVIAQGANMLFTSRAIAHDGTGSESGAARTYACSLRFKKSILVGLAGRDGHLVHRFSFLLGNESYAAFVYTSSSENPTSNETQINVVSLDTGRFVTQTAAVAPLGARRDVDGVVSSLVLNDGGKIAWIATRGSAVDGDTREVNEALPLVAPRAVHSDQSIDPFLLAFAGGEPGTSEWSSQTTTASVVPRMPGKARKPLKQSCIRRGETRYMGEVGQTIARKKSRRAGWRDHFVLFACSDKYHRRVFLGHFGWHGDLFYSPGEIRTNERFVAHVSDRIDPDLGTAGGAIQLVDLSTGNDLLAAQLPSGAVALALDDVGDVAWVDYTGPPRGGPHIFRLHLQDARNWGTGGQLAQWGGGSPLLAFVGGTGDQPGARELHYPGDLDWSSHHVVTP